LERFTAADIGSESRFLPTPPALGEGGSRRNIAMPFGTEKLEWLGCPINFEDMFIRFDTIHERDGQTDRQADRHIDTA